MNYLYLIIIAIAGIVLGTYLGRRQKTGKESSPFNNAQGKEGLIEKQATEKAAHKQRILEFFDSHPTAANNDIENLLGVSDATATRYLDELEKEGKIRQVGKTGKFVHYEKI